MPRFSAYVASKSALDAFSRCIASEIIDDGVHVTTINMPLVRTPMIAPTKMYDRFPTITPDKAADMICEAIIHRPKRIATPLGTLGRLHSEHYQCTPRIRCASAVASPDARSTPSLSPLAAEDSGNTLEAMCRIWSTAFGASA
jgi:short-subunit dehydrogenase